MNEKVSTLTKIRKYAHLMFNCNLVIRNFAAVLSAVICLAQVAWADTGAEIRDYINGLHPTGDIVATFSPGTNTVIVTGRVGAAPSTANYLTLNIDYGVKVIWEAELAGNPSGNFSLINISGGLGTFEVRNGSLENTGTGRAITNNSVCAVNIMGGTVSATTGYAIYNASTGVISVLGSSKITSANSSSLHGTIYLDNSGTASVARLIISEGTVENTAINGNTIFNYSTGAVEISGGTVRATTGCAIYSYSIYSNGIYGYGYYAGEVNISGGTVCATNGTGIYIRHLSSNYNYSGAINILGGVVSIAVRLTHNYLI